MNKTLPANTPMRQLPFDTIYTQVLARLEEVHRFKSARQLAATYCPTASSIEVIEENSSDPQNSRLREVNFRDSGMKRIDLHDPQVAWHVINNSPELRLDFFTSNDVEHTPHAAADWLVDQLFDETCEHPHLFGFSVNLNREAPPINYYVQAEDGSYELLETRRQLQRLQASVTEYSAWQSACEYLDRYVPFADGVHINYAQEYDDEGGYYPVVSNVIPVDKSGAPIDLQDPEIALKCIKSNPNLRKPFEAHEAEPEDAPDYLDDAMFSDMYDFEWGNAKAIYLHNQPTQPLVFTPVEE